MGLRQQFKGTSRRGLKSIGIDLSTIVAPWACAVPRRGKVNSSRLDAWLPLLGYASSPCHIRGMDAFDGFKSKFHRLTLVLRARGRRMDEAEDAVQEAYVRLLEYVNRGQQVLEPEAFLAHVAYNVSVDNRRRHSTRLKDSRPLEKILLLELKPGPEDVAATEQCLQQTQELLESALGERARKVFFLHCFDGFTYAEIAQQINMSIRTVEKDLVKALKVLAVADLPKPDR